MSHISFAITWCLLGFASCENVNWNAQIAEFQSNLSLPTSTHTEKRHRTIPDELIHDVAEFRARYSSCDHAEGRDPQSGFLTQLETDPQFWKTYRDFDADADSMLAWREFQVLMDDQN